jgi:hypothetical protein
MLLKGIQKSILKPSTKVPNKIDKYSLLKGIVLYLLLLFDMQPKCKKVIAYLS